MRFQDAARDARAVVYAGIQAEPLVARAADLIATASSGQRVMARAVMNGETADADGWRTTFPTLFAAAASADERAQSEALLACSLEVADRGDEIRNQLRGAIVEAVTERLLAVPGHFGSSASLLVSRAFCSECQASLSRVWSSR